MRDFLVVHQLNIMLVLAGVCGIIAFFVFVTSFLPKVRKVSLMLLELSGMFLMIYERYSYIYRGDTSKLGFFMVRLSNFMVFSLVIVVVESFNFYMKDLMLHEGGMKNVPVRLRYVDALSGLAVFLIVVSQFTGLYYTIDENNLYHRAPGFIVCYAIPVVILLIEFSAIIQYGKVLRRGLEISLLLFSFVPLVAAVFQVKMYGVSLTSVSFVGMLVVLYVFALIDMDDALEKAHKAQVEDLTEQQESMSRLFEQTAAALAGAIDSSISHTNGHSRRVAEYSKEIAKIAGKSSEECREAYFAALLHDVGKMSLPHEVLNKQGEASGEDQKIMQEHVSYGESILSEIKEYPYLGEVAKYHHEHFDGQGYPEGLKGEEIPELARIVAVADAYDTMTSRKADRPPLPQIRVREEFLKEGGGRFDPEFSQAMVRMIDADTGYNMKYDGDGAYRTIDAELKCESYRSDISVGIPVREKVVNIKFSYSPLNKDAEEFSVPAAILFDSLDGRVHATESAIVDNGYMEFGEVWFDGHAVATRARNIKTTLADIPLRHDSKESIRFKKVTYEIEAGRFRDHFRIVVKGPLKIVECIVALPDNVRYSYIGLTGENCLISDIEVTEKDEVLSEGDIPRIAEEITYTDRLESDIKNIQIDGHRSATTEGVRVEDGMRIAFHAFSLPTANLVWHCPYVVLYQSDDKKVNGEGYRELALVRLDGEVEGLELGSGNNTMVVNKTDEFVNWDKWKERNKHGLECLVNFSKKGNKVTVTAEDAGIIIKNTTVIDKNSGDVYAALTGDQCVLTDIRVI